MTQVQTCKHNVVIGYGACPRCRGKSLEEMVEVRYPICPDCGENLLTSAALRQCPCCALVFGQSWTGRAGEDERKQDR